MQYICLKQETEQRKKVNEGTTMQYSLCYSSKEN